MPGPISLSLFRELVPSGFAYGGSYLVEFEPHSLWYEVSLALATEGLKSKLKVDYHTFLHTPSEIRTSLETHGINIRDLEEKQMFRVLDSFTVTTGLETPSAGMSFNAPFQSKTLDLKEWAKSALHESKGGAQPMERQRLHIDDDLSVLAQYNDEKTFIDYWRTKFLPHTRALELTVFHSLALGIHSDAFYRQFETLCDGIIDMKSQERDGRMRHHVRVRTMRGKTHDSAWRQISLLDTGDIVLSGTTAGKGLGLRGWMKGPSKA